MRFPRFASVVSGSAAAVLLGLAITLASLPRGAQAQQTALESSRAASVAKHVETVGFTVSDMERSIAFYRDVLTFEVVSDVEVAGEAFERLTGVFGVRLRIVTMRLGEERIELTEYLTHRGRPVPLDSASNDRWFQHIAIIVPDMSRAYAHLRANRVRHASTGPQRLPDWNPNAGGIEAFYFRDPDDHVLEVLAFPEGKGDPKWRERTKRDPDRLFLGIDHTAIVIGDTEASLAFYRDVLGMNIAGASENFGTEQEHLNNVFGAHLRITSLRPSESRGPAIEFLHYLAPTHGRPFPADSRTTDLWHWQTTIEVADFDAAVTAITRESVVWVSLGAVTLEGNASDCSRAMVVRDPDGHALRLVERNGS